MSTTLELSRLHDQALDDAGHEVDRVRPEDLHRATPCEGWDLRTLLAHLAGQQEGFAAAVADGDASAAAYAPVAPDTDDPAAAWHASAQRLRAALDATEGTDREIRLVELSPERSFPLDVVRRIQLLDTVVHTWDVARALDRPYRPEPALIDLVAETAAGIPDGAAREVEGAAFRHPVVLPADRETEDAWVAALARLGRDDSGRDW